jgi:putative spermidine/putrescine transport system ATP-binding protein
MSAASKSAAPVRLKELTKLFGETRAADRVSLTIEPGSMVALLGPLGCGKTTTLRMIAGLVEPDAGEILLDDRSITHVPVHRRNIGMLFQNDALFPHMNVAENIAFGLETRGVKHAAIAARVADALQLVQLAKYGDRMPGKLSGSQQRRGAGPCARRRAGVVLLDEPLGALDKALHESMEVELRALQQRLGITTIMVTHDQDEALTMADRIVIMRDGRIEQVGAPAEIISVRSRVLSPGSSARRISCAAGSWIPQAGVRSSVCRTTRSCRSRHPGRSAATSPSRSGPRPYRSRRHLSRRHLSR